MSSLRFKHLALAACVATGLVMFVSATAIAGPYYPAGPRDDLTPLQQSKCPPVDPNTDKIPPLGEDKNVAGHKGKNGKVDPNIKDAYMGKWHWDDGKGHDLTVERWCINSRVWYFSVRVIVSNGIGLNKKYTTVVAPQGADGAVDAGFC